MMNDIETITIVIADDHSLIRQGIEFVIEDLNISYKTIHASNLSQIMEIVNNQKIDLLICDAYFPDGNSLSIIKNIKDQQSDIIILIFSGLDEKEYALKFLKAGANGFLSKLSEEEEIAKALQQIIEKGKYISALTQELIVDSIHNSSSINLLEKLTDRELEIAKLYTKGLGNLEIANTLDIKQNTVSTIKKRIFDKLQIGNIVELIELFNKHS